MLALGIIFTILGSFLLLFYFLLIISYGNMINISLSFMRTISAKLTIVGLDKNLGLLRFTILFCLPGVIFLTLGIIFIKKANKKKLQKQKSNEEKFLLQKQNQELKRKELEIKILKEKNLSKTNQDVFCVYCGAKLSKDALKCENCGGVVRKEE